MGISILLFVLLQGWANIAECAPSPNGGSIACPLNFTGLRKFSDIAQKARSYPLILKCTVAREGLHIVLSEYLRTHGLFLPPENASEACWDAYQKVIKIEDPAFDVRSSCGFETRWIATGCMGITTRRQFEGIVPVSSRREIERSCNQSLDNGAHCSQCSTTLTTVQALFLGGPQEGNVTLCSEYPNMYAAATVTPFGPTEPQTTWCLFLYGQGLDSQGRKAVSRGLKLGLAGASAVIAATVMVLMYLKLRMRANAKKPALNRWESQSAVLNPNSMLKRYSIEEIRAATGNFSGNKLLGKGGFGNVYKGVLPDGSVVALKRFKNCTPEGDAQFVQELEIIASVRHRNLLALRGFCMTSVPYEGHQRIIVCEYMPNGSLHDHLFGSPQRRLDWPTRERIAMGMARGLAYLHHEADPAIIHRDIKASNILLDDQFEARLADFGLAKFNPEGLSHLSTRVAGTLGYVSPEYAMYGQVTEKSDVYSFGVVLLELLSGKKAIISNGPSEPTHISDWAWSLLKSARELEVIEEGMENQGSPELMAKFVMLALLCSHPKMLCRPTANQALKIMMADLPLPPIPDRPIPLIAHSQDIDGSFQRSDSRQLPSYSVSQSFGTETSLDASTSHKIR